MKCDGFRHVRSTDTGTGDNLLPVISKCNWFLSITDPSETTPR